MSVALRVDPADPTPAYEQLRRQLAGLIRTGSVAVGTRLPTVRQLAHEFGEYVVREVYNRSDRQTQQEVRTAYEAWLAANGLRRSLDGAALAAYRYDL